MKKTYIFFLVVAPINYQLWQRRIPTQSRLTQGEIVGEPLTLLPAVAVARGLPTAGLLRPTVATGSSIQQVRDHMRSKTSLLIVEIVVASTRFTGDRRNQSGYTIDPADLPMLNGMAHLTWMSTLHTSVPSE